MIEISKVMLSLAEQRKFFFSEADFQHSLAWQIQGCFPNASIQLERPTNANGKNLHLDFLVQMQGHKIAFELKYKTKKLTVKLGEEEFHLKDHNAHASGRYDFIKDICRLVPVYDLFIISARNANETNCKLVLSFRSQFFHSLLHFSSHANDRSTTHRCGMTAKVCSSLRLATCTEAPSIVYVSSAKGSPVYPPSTNMLRTSDKLS